jgi:hypothetical protein
LMAGLEQRLLQTLDFIRHLCVGNDHLGDVIAVRAAQNKNLSAADSRGNGNAPETSFSCPRCVWHDRRLFCWRKVEKQESFARGCEGSKRGRTDGKIR